MRYSCRQVGFPVMIKATAGGGGRGMRLAMKESEFYSLLKQASQEAEGAFGNGAVYLERYVQNPRHIEFQARPRPVGDSVFATTRIGILPSCATVAILLCATISGSTSCGATRMRCHTPCNCWQLPFGLAGHPMS